MLFASKEHKIVVVGPRKVGKSALVVRFLTKRFICEYVENTDMPCQRETEVDGERLKVHIQDTSDKGMTSASIEHYLRWADALMMIYSVTDADGFRQLKTTAKKIIEKTNDLKEREQKNTTPLVLVGNKGDLEIVRKVSRLEGLELAEQLRCEFFEASAREGWSKLLSNGSYSPPWSVSTSDGDTTSNAPTPRASPRNSPCHTSNFAKKSALMYNNGKDNISKSEKSSFSRWGSLKTSKQLKRYGRSFSMTCPPPIISFADAPEPEGSSTIPRMNSFPISPASSRENLNDDIKESQLLFPRRTRLSVPSNPGILGRISPRLGRRFSRSSKKENKNSRDDNNNNNSERKNQELTLSLSLNCLENETEYEISEQKLELVSDCGPCCSSNYGSTESLASAGLEPDNRFPDSSIFSLPSPKRFNTSQVQEQDFSSSEPFLLLCRIGSLSRARSRSRSPSHRIINGLKKIRSLASDLNSQVPSPTKQTNGSLLAPPYNL